VRDELDIPMPRMAPAEPGYRLTSRREPVDSGSKRLALIAGGAAGVLVLLGGTWALSRHHHTVVPVVMADSRPLRTRPENPGGLQVQGEDDAILSGANDTKDAMAPPPEVPAPQTLQLLAQQETAAKQAAAAAAANPPPAAPAAAAAAPSASPNPPAAVAQAAPVAVPPPSAPVGHAAVQLAAVGSEEAALSEWQRLSHRMPDLLSGRQPTVSKTEHGGRTYYRLRTGGFADIAQATAFCEQVRAKGNGCMLTSL
jgi:hypothetical protein